ncbi:hypothetical protein JCM1840_005321 [Sporobolomyces johnsonii]
MAKRYDDLQELIINYGAEHLPDVEKSQAYKNVMRQVERYELPITHQRCPVLSLAPLAAYSALLAPASLSFGAALKLPHTR